MPPRPETRQAADAVWGKGSLLATSLTGETLYRIELSADGRSAVGREALYQGDFGRLRDVLVGPDGNVYLARGASLLATSLTGETLYRIELSADGRSAVGREALYQGDFGRLRDVLVGPDGNVYLATSNRDGRGSPAADDDRILRITR